MNSLLNKRRKIDTKYYKEALKFSDLIAKFSDIKYYKNDSKDYNEYYAVLPNGIWYFMDTSRHKVWILPYTSDWNANFDKRHWGKNGWTKPNVHSITLNELKTNIFKDLL